ncbi:MAG: PASTA domain-containing protein [Myxococcales bacterium]|nr:PASTA domain-containing protein [Myxococcales bacterium]
MAGPLARRRLRVLGALAVSGCSLTALLALEVPGLLSWGEAEAAGSSVNQGLWLAERQRHDLELQHGLDRVESWEESRPRTPRRAEVEAEVEAPEPPVEAVATVAIPEIAGLRAYDARRKMKEAGLRMVAFDEWGTVSYDDLGSYRVDRDYVAPDPVEKGSKVRVRVEARGSKKFAVGY